MTKKIIGFIGLIGTGKDFYAEQVIKELEEKGEIVVKIGFSDGVRESAFSILGHRPSSHEDYENWKNDSFKVIRETVSGDLITAELGKGRDILLNVGTDTLKRVIGDPIWCMAWMKKLNRIIAIEAPDVIIVHDIRHEDEAESFFLGASLTGYSPQVFYTKFQKDNKFKGLLDENGKIDVSKLHESEHFAAKFFDRFEDMQDITNEIQEFLSDKNNFSYINEYKPK